MSTLSVAIIARDEERHIGGCLESIAGVADEVVIVLDARSRDRTEEVGRAHGAHIFVEAWQSYPAQRNRALAHCRGDWVLFVDADERLTPELRHELRTLQLQPGANQQENGQRIGGYWIPRSNQFFGQALRGGGWYPDRQLRLLWRTTAHYPEDRLVHEVASYEGAADTLKGHLLHINIESLGEFWQKQTAYALAEARMLSRAGHRTRWRNFVGSPLREFWRRYVRLGGWRDGPLGFFLCASLAWFEVVKYSFLLLLPHP